MVQWYYDMILPRCTHEYPVNIQSIPIPIYYVCILRHPTWVTGPPSQITGMFISERLEAEEGIFEIAIGVT